MRGGRAASMLCFPTTFWTRWYESFRGLPANRRTQREIRDLADSFLALAEIAEPNSEIEPALRDPADQQILGTLRASRADYLITGDKDLLALGEKYPIVKPATFWRGMVVKLGVLKCCRVLGSCGSCTIWEGTATTRLEPWDTDAMLLTSF